jgi:hypothetical protein
MRLIDKSAQGVEMSDTLNPGIAPANELERRRLAARRIVLSLMVLTAGLSLAARLGRSHFTLRESQGLDTLVKISIVFGLVGVVWRRARLAATRLQNIGVLKGSEGLLQALEQTTLQVAILGAIIPIIGFVASVLTANDYYAYGTGLIGLFVQLCCYPLQQSWQRVLTTFAPN